MRMGKVTAVAEKEGAESERQQRAEATLKDLTLSITSLNALVCYVCILLQPHRAVL